MTFPAPIIASGNSVAIETVPLNAIPTRWDAPWAELAAHASEPNPFAEQWFLRPAIRHFEPHPSDWMIGIWRDTMLIGMFPLTQAMQYGRMPIRHVENWAHYHCFLGTPLVRAGYERLFWTTVLASLDEARWASNFLHIIGMDLHGSVLAGLRGARRVDIVHRTERAMLRSGLTSTAYYDTNVRQKKRKEFRRLRSRLEELGKVAFTELTSDAHVGAWADDFLTLEASGWKGRARSALNADTATKTFFVEVVSGAHRAGKLEMLRMTHDGKPIAMLVNFITPPGAHAFKIAFDEDYARFSLGVQIKIENLKTLDRSDILWSDSCAVEDHPMINSLWTDRREIVRVTVPLAGARRKAVFHGARALETLAATVRRR